MNPRDFEPTLQAAPSPNRPTGPTERVDPQVLALLILVGGAAVAAVALLLPGTWGEYYATRLWLPLWVLGCLVFGGALLENRSRWVIRISRVSRNRLVDWGGGAYGAIALVCFGWSEFDQLRETAEWLSSIDWQAGGGAVREMAQGLAHNMFQLVFQSIMNGIQAFIWPAFWKQSFSAGNMWPAAVVGWGVFESARYAVLQVARPAKP